MKPLLSVITPTYNAEEFVKEGVQSISWQTLNKKQYEWIILDDGSVDNTVGKLKKYVGSFNNFYLFSRNKNFGTSATREQAINLSEGKYLVFFDVDDILEKNALESTLNFMESNPHIKFSYSRHKRIDKNGGFICDRPGYGFFRENLLHFNFVGPLKCIYRELHNEINGFDSSFFKYSEDYDYILRISESLNRNQIKQNPDYLYRYRIHPDNNMKKIKDMRKNACLAIQNSLKRKEGINADVFWSHLTEDKYNYYDWRVK